MTTVHARLCAVLRTLNAESMTTDQLAERCLAGVSGATIEDVIAAMRAVAEEQLEHARQLRVYHARRRAGIRGVIDGG